jgi:hypothetical protein
VVLSWEVVAGTVPVEAGMKVLDVPLVVARAELERGRHGALRGQLRALIEELDIAEGETCYRRPTSS